MSFRLSVTHLALAVVLLVTGCLPSSCQRDEARPLFPSDSLSRGIAAQAPTDTLETLWHGSGIEGDEMEFPRTVLFGNGGALWVSDAERHEILHFSSDGDVQEVLRADHIESPYLAGFRGDTLYSFSPFNLRLDAFAAGEHIESIQLPVTLHEESPLVWATVSDDYYYVKLLGEEKQGRIVQIDNSGNVVGEHAMPGPSWRRSGLLRIWDDHLLSLSGFRPVVDVLPRNLSGNSGAEPDTLALRGFDSPMMGRSRAFVEGDVNRGPILTESATPLGDRLFVLNIRPGWVQVDVFDREGMLERRLTQRETRLARNFYPRDLAIRERDDGIYEIAIVYTDPIPRVTVFEWTPGHGADVEIASEETTTQETSHQTETGAPEEERP